jgi:hypothetical protein
MSVIMIRCPETGSETSTGIECEGDDFRSLPFVITHATCPSCGREHSWSKSDAFKGRPNQREGLDRFGARPTSVPTPRKPRTCSIGENPERGHCVNASTLLYS